MTWRVVAAAAFGGDIALLVRIHAGEATTILARVLVAVLGWH
jgi:hypothetical protein